jgi:exopolyphosphatase/guanosine-5'-triphosphate,3'-diphosphate pyrophosphatase
VSRCIGAIDIGSNSIKVMTARVGKVPHRMEVVQQATSETRISKGISGHPPLLGASAIKAGVEAVGWLHAQSKDAGAEEVHIVATSAVRSAANGAEFCRRVKEASGTEVRVLTGDEEAEWIALGVRSDPLVETIFDDCVIFDLGGGSMEWIRIREGQLHSRVSLPIGAVRLTEQFVADPSQPLGADERGAIRAHVAALMESARVEPCSRLIGCSGGLSILRSTAVRDRWEPTPAAPAILSWDYLRPLGEQVMAQTLDQRIQTSGLPAPRADVFPSAFIVYEEVLRRCATDQILHSWHNLRFGVVSAAMGWRLSG